jgi:hypothetical protein
MTLFVSKLKHFTVEFKIKAIKTIVGIVEYKLSKCVQDFINIFPEF